MTLLQLEQLKQACPPHTPRTTKEASSIDYEWAKSLVGLRMIVPEKWWNGCSTFEPNEGVIIGFDPNTTKERYFLLQLDSESNPARHSSGPYQMRYDAVYKYADTYDEDYSTYDLPEEPGLHQVTLKPGLVSCPQDSLVRQPATDSEGSLVVALR